MGRAGGEVTAEELAGLYVILATGELRIEVCEYWPSDLARLFRQAGLPRRTRHRARRQPPGAGQCTLRVVDDRGRSTSRQVMAAAP